MDLSTAQRLLPLLPTVHSSNPSPKPRVRRPSLSPVPVKYELLYQQMVMKEKEFIRGNPYAQRMASHVAIHRGGGRRNVRGPGAELRESAMRRTAGLGVDGLSVLYQSQTKSPLRTKLQPYIVDQTWVASPPKTHRRMASIGNDAKETSKDRVSLSPRAIKGKMHITTVNISLPTVKATSKHSESRLLREDLDPDDQRSAHGVTYDTSVRRSRKLPTHFTKGVTFPPL